MNIWLFTEDLHLLELRHKKERDKRIAERIKAVILFHKGWLHKEIAEALLISPESVSRHIEEYQTEEKLSPSNGGSSSKLNAEQTPSLIAHLEEHMYTKLQQVLPRIQLRHMELRIQKKACIWPIGIKMPDFSCSSVLQTMQ